MASVLAGHDAEAVLIPEPFGPTILTHQLGVVWFKIAVQGVPSHVQDTQAGTNAIEKMYSLISGLRQLEFKLNDVEGVSKTDPWLSANPPKVNFYGFRSDGHGVSKDLPAFRVLNESHQALTGGDSAPAYIATATTDLRAFVHFGQGQGTCFGPVAENIHAANERVNLESVNHVARVYALFIARWCGLME